MFDIIVREFIEEVMGMCLDNEIESYEIPGVIVKMLLEIGDYGDTQKLFEEITEDCNLDPYGNAINQVEVFEEVYNEIKIYFDREVENLTYKYQDAGLSYKDAKKRALGTEYLKHIIAMLRVLNELIIETKEHYEVV